MHTPTSWLRLDVDFAEGQSHSDRQADNDSEADSPVKKGNPGGFDELNSQTQRVLRGIVGTHESRPQWFCRSMRSFHSMLLQTVQSVTR